MPRTALNESQQTVHDRIATLVDAAKLGKLKAELTPLRAQFIEGRNEGLTATHLATEIVKFHPLFKDAKISSVTKLIEEIATENNGAK
jgi:hypothetical protein